MSCESTVRRLLDSWYLMRIEELASAFLSEEHPQQSWPFKLVVGLCHSFIRAKYTAPLSQLATGDESAIYNAIESAVAKMNFAMEASELHATLNELDRGKGVLISAHWLTYIFDMQEKAEYVWHQFPLFYSMASEMYFGDGIEKIKRHFSLENRPKDPLSGLSLAHRFYKNRINLKRQLERTLEYLSTFKTLPRYLEKTLEGCDGMDQKSWIRIMAAALNRMTYDRGEISGAESAYEYARRNGFLEAVEVRAKDEILRVKVPGSKRLWSAIRDYALDPYLRRLFVGATSKDSSMGGYFRELDAAANRDIARYEEYLEQLDLPGDVWNKRFGEMCLDPIKPCLQENERRHLGVRDIRKAARRWYLYLCELKHEKGVHGKLLPVYLDATFKLREKDLSSLLSNAGEIRTAIDKEVGEVGTRDGIISAYKTLRRLLSEHRYRRP